MMLLMAYCTVSPFLTCRKLVKRLNYTRLAISDEDISLSIPSLQTVQIKFADIKLIDKMDYGLTITGGLNGKKITMITNKFQGFNEIVARVEAVVPYTFVKSSLGVLLRKAEQPMAI